MNNDKNASHYRPRILTCDRGGLFQMAEVWLKNRGLFESLSAEMAALLARSRPGTGKGFWRRSTTISPEQYPPGRSGCPADLKRHGLSDSRLKFPTTANES